MYVFWRWVFQAGFSIQVSVHLFLTAFSVFGSWINFIKILISCFFQFTPFCPDLWKLFHPLMSEPNIPVHPNKQVFWQTLLWFYFWLSEWVKTPADLSFSGAQSCEGDKDWYSKKIIIIFVINMLASSKPLFCTLCKLNFVTFLFLLSSWLLKLPNVGSQVNNLFKINCKCKLIRIMEVSLRETFFSGSVNLLVSRLHWLCGKC